VRVAALYDIHGNLPALEAVLADLEGLGTDRLVLGGDLATGPMPKETLDLLVGLGDRALAIRGNADRELVAAFDGQPPDASQPEEVQRLTEWAASRLDRPSRDFLAQLPLTVELDVDGLGRVLFCHATPHDDVGLFTPATPAEWVAELLQPLEAATVVCGHTHLSFERVVDGVRVVNPGSVGMPYGDAAAHWLLLGPGVEFRSTAYDLEEAATRVRRTGCPLAEMLAEQILRPPTAAEAIEVFEARVPDRRR
jgi:putative phosphoesterase